VYAYGFPLGISTMAAVRVRSRPRPPLRLIRFSVSKLFGLFNHQIPLSQDERITIVHARNGYGKTVILNLISALFSDTPTTATLRAFWRYEFSQISFDFQDGRNLVVTQSKPRLSVSDKVATRSPRPKVTFELRTNKKRVNRWSPNPRRPDFPLFYVESRLPDLTRIGATRWRVRGTGEELDLEEVIDRYGARAPFLQRYTESEQPEWFVELRQAITCSLIETQRLTVQRPQSERRVGASSQAIWRVQELALGLAAIMAAEVQKYAALSQQLDQTFPRRFLERENKGVLPTPQLQAALKELEISRKRLKEVGLLRHAEHEVMLSGQQLRASDQGLFTLYAEDTKEKLGIFDDILRKIELFKNIINKRFEFKTLKTNLEKGFYFTNSRGAILDLTDLSSGEQHELVLFYDLLFRTRPNSLILLDEPEISLHIGWQRQFLPDLLEVLKLAPIDVVISTHSPHLAAGKLGLMVRLEAPK
jgi:ABC-type lipoprotein export system ATPase subunit